MKAIVITAPGPPEVLTVSERPLPEPGPSEIRVRVHASALNRADLLQRLGRYPAPSGAPADIPGLEYAGEVDAVGPDVELWRPGDRVMGIVGGGGHAEYVRLHEREAIPIPSSLDWTEAAAIPEAFLTAYDALQGQLRITAGERVLIHAVGSGVGTAALQIARLAGAFTIGTSRTVGKLERATALGLDRGITAGSEEWLAEVDEATAGDGVDAILDLVGGEYFDTNVRALRERGRMVVVGLVAGSRAPIDLGSVLRKRLSIRGTVLRSRPLEEKIAVAREFARTMVPRLATGQLRPIIDRVYPFEEIAAAHRRLEANESFGKIVLTW